MAVAKKDQERVNYAWMYGAQGRKDGKNRKVTDYWQEYADVWLQGFDGEPNAGATRAKLISDELEAELDETVVSDPPQ